MHNANMSISVNRAERNQGYRDKQRIAIAFSSCYHGYKHIGLYKLSNGCKADSTPILEWGILRNIDAINLMNACIPLNILSVRSRSNYPQFPQRILDYRFGETFYHYWQLRATETMQLSESDAESELLPLSCSHYALPRLPARMRLAFFPKANVALV